MAAVAEVVAGKAKPAAAGGVPIVTPITMGWM
jgi:hypothetical protein